jgi:hypothetical protein
MSHPDQRNQVYLVNPKMRYLLLGCILLAAAFNGVSGSGINRVLIEMPAWQHTGALAWAAYSRWSDMGTNGLILYPLEKIGGTVGSVAAAIIFFVNRWRFPRDGALPIYGAAFFAICSLLVTTQAAPLMMTTVHSSDPAVLQNALNGFSFWEAIRAGVQALSFCGNLWSLMVISRLHIASKEIAN